MELISNKAIPLEWRIMIAVAKEREFKREGCRFYAKMVQEMRLYQVATGANIARQIFPYVKQHSMTMSEEEYMQTIIKLDSQKNTDSDHSHTFIIVDFSSRCGNFRYELATPVFRELDKLFCLRNIYSETHLFPMMSRVVFQNRFDPPLQLEDGSPKPGNKCVFGPEAWLDGLRQKGWTLVTILLILSVTAKMGTAASLLGQGDNQVICLKIPPKKYLESVGKTKDSYVDDFMNELVATAERAGIPIRKEESGISTLLFEFARRYLYNGAQMRGALKRISRVSSEANQTISTLNGDISGMFSAGTASAAEDKTPIPSYLTTVLKI